MCVGKWSLKGKGQGKEAKPVFLCGRPERCRATREKRRKLEGSREVGGRGLIMPCVEKERGNEAEAPFR